MNGFERRKQKKIEQIYNVSFQLFLQHGFQKVSVNEIAQMANVSPATIYNYFGTKEQLYADMLIHWVDKQLQQYEAILKSERSFPEKTREIMLLEATNLHILSNELQKEPPSEVGGFKHLLETYTEQKVVEFFMKYVALGKQSGFIHQNQTEENVMLYFSMFKNELGKRWDKTNHETNEIGIDQLIELFFYGLAGQAQN